MGINEAGAWVGLLSTVVILVGIVEDLGSTAIIISGTHNKKKRNEILEKYTLAPAIHE